MCDNSEAIISASRFLEPGVLMWSNRNEANNEMHFEACNQVWFSVQEHSLIKGHRRGSVTISMVSGARASLGSTVTCP